VTDVTNTLAYGINYGCKKISVLVSTTIHF
jgi:hypothetical protein